MHAVAVRVLVKLVSLVDAGHQEVGVATLRGVLLLQVQIQQLTRSIIVLLGHLSGSLALRLVCILDKAARPREQGNLPLAVGIVVALLLREHHVEVEGSDAKLDGATGSVKFFGFVDVIIDVLELGVGAGSLDEADAVLLVDSKATTTLSRLDVRPKYLTSWVHFRHSVELELALLIQVALPLLIG